MSDSPLDTKPRAVLPPPGVHVAGDSPCVRCGYNLRTLPLSASCPECGAPVAYSFRGYFLQYADPHWVRGLARGLALLLAATLVTLVLGIVVTVIGVIHAPAWQAAPTPSGHSWMLMPQSVVRALYTGLAVAGLWLFSRREPAQTADLEGRTARRLIRAAVVVLPGLLVVNLSLLPLFSTLVPPTGPPTTAAVLAALKSPWIVVASAIGLLEQLAYVAVVLALLRRLSALMQRIPRPGLARFARIEFWGCGVSIAITALGYLFMALAILPAFSGLIAAPIATTTAPVPATQPVTAGGYASPVIATGPSSTRPTTLNSWLTQTSVPLGVPSPSVVGLTTAPTTRPATPLFAPPPAFASGMVLTGCIMLPAMCGLLIFGVGAIVLLVLACIALYDAAHAAEHSATVLRRETSA